MRPKDSMVHCLRCGKDVPPHRSSRAAGWQPSPTEHECCPSPKYVVEATRLYFEEGIAKKEKVLIEILEKDLGRIVTLDGTPIKIS
jgi:hypothetical protein